MKLVSAARCAIRMRSMESDHQIALKALKRDLLNGPRHCFGIHTDCSADFCTTVKASQQSASPLSQENGGNSGGEGNVAYKYLSLSNCRRPSLYSVFS